MGHKAEDHTQRKLNDEMGNEWDLGSSSEIVVSVGDFNGHVGKCAESVEGIHGGNGIGKKCRRKIRFVRQTKGKSLIVPVDVKQKLILCL